MKTTLRTLAADMRLATMPMLVQNLANRGILLLVQLGTASYVGIESLPASAVPSPTRRDCTLMLF
jgi:hypothetical protein